MASVSVAAAVRALPASFDKGGGEGMGERIENLLFTSGGNRVI